MALITRGSIDDFSAGVMQSPLKRFDAVRQLRTFTALESATRALQPIPLEFATSTEPRGLALKSLSLTQGFDGILGKVFNRTKRVYFVSWAWDLSPTVPYAYPGIGAGEAQCLIRLKAKEVREFMGSGTLLFPARTVSAGLNVRLQLWQSRQGERNFGTTLNEVATAIQRSELNNLLTGLALITGATTTTVALVKDASIELAKVIGTILKASSDDFVDFFEGSWPALEGWQEGDESYRGFASEIVLRRQT